MIVEPTPEQIEALARRIAPSAWLPYTFTTGDANLRRDAKRRREDSIRKATAALNPNKIVTCQETTS